MERPPISLAGLGDVIPELIWTTLVLMSYLNYHSIDATVGSFLALLNIDGGTIAE